MNFLLLALYTLVLGFLTYKIYRKTGEFAFVLGAVLMYYWSLMGAWFILYDDVTGDGGKDFGVHYYHLREILFPLKVDSNYTYAITLYFLFIAVVLSAIWYFTSGKKNLNQLGQPVQ